MRSPVETLQPPIHTKKKGITCRIVTPNLNRVIILQVESYTVTTVQVVNICLHFAIQDIIRSIETNL